MEEQCEIRLRGTSHHQVTDRDLLQPFQVVQVHIKA